MPGVDLNVYRDIDAGLTDAERNVARLFADQAAVLLANAFTLADNLEVAEQLEEALDTRSSNEQGAIFSAVARDRYVALLDSAAVRASTFKRPTGFTTTPGRP